MDRDKVLKLITSGMSGIIEWNRYVLANDASPDLRNADLRNAKLGGVNLQGANLRSAFLSGADLAVTALAGADLSLADLSNANLRRADLRDAKLDFANLNAADLSDATLSEADLSDASLSGANLSGANLSGASFHTANLKNADLSRAVCERTLLVKVDLSCVSGLDSVRNFGPSSIGIDTIFLSKGKIPEQFLRGCGVPESLIQSLPLILNSTEPIQFYSCFISYSSEDGDFAKRLHADLQLKGVRTWFDREDLKIGDRIRPGINEAIRVHDKLMLVLSEQSIASDWVEGEVEAALERERREKRTVLFPIRLDDSVLETQVAWAAHLRQTRHIGDFRGWENQSAYQIAFTRLLEDLKAPEGAE